MIKPSNSVQTQFSAAIPFLADLGLFAILFAGFYFLPIPQLLPCAYPLAEKSVLAFCIALLILIFAFKKISFAARSFLTGINIVLSALILWLGIYSISPLGFSSGRIPLVQGFVLTQSMRPDVRVSSGNTINVIAGAPIALQVVTIPVARNCTWVSAKNGSMDDPASCDIAYKPPANSDFDLLKVLVQPACQLPEAQENIRIDVLP